MNFTTPVEIDTELARLYQAEEIARGKHERIQNSMRRFAAGEAYHTPYIEQDAADALNEVHAVIDQELPLEAEYEGRPWQRYWHVTNANGHIHRNQSCTSCFWDTQYAWRTDLSGLTEAEVVEREAYNACSVCMPIAPAEQKAARERYNKQQREARKAEKDAKKAAKAEKAHARAVKHVDKVQAEIEKMGGHATFANDFSLYGHDGKRSVYNWECPAMVAQTLYAMKESQEDGRSMRDINDAVLAELRVRGLVV